MLRVKATHRRTVIQTYKSHHITYMRTIHKYTLHHTDEREGVGGRPNTYDFIQARKSSRMVLLLFWLPWSLSSTVLARLTFVKRSEGTLLANEPSKNEIKANSARKCDRSLF